MADGLHGVAITGTGSFLPNDPVPNDQIDAVLGELTEAPASVRRFMASTGRRILHQAGFESRHFAVDPRAGGLTHTVASLAEEAARRALEAAGRAPTDVQLLLLSSANYDMMTPPTSSLLQERLGIESCAEMEVHSNCSGVGKCLQIAYDALRLGRYDRALVVYAQHSSVLLRAQYFNQAKMTPEHAALRYILADGAGAVLLERVEAGSQATEGHEVLATFVESVGGKRKAGMSAGAGVADAGRFATAIHGIYDAGAHHLAQDFVAITRDAAPLLLAGLLRMLAGSGFDPTRIDHFVLSIPSRHLYDQHRARFRAALGESDARCPFRGARTGYCGGASLLVHLDQMARAGEIGRGHLVALHALESSKWMTAGFVVRW